MKLEHRQTHTLRVHPAVKSIPELDHESPEFLAIATCHEHDLGRPLNIDTQGRTLDDTSRSLLAVAKRWQHEEVPVRVCDEADVYWIAIQDLAGRRHVTKSAIAFMVVPLLAPELEERRRRSQANLKTGKNPNVSPKRPETPREPCTLEQLAKHIGICPRTVDRAVKLHTLLDKHGDRRMRATIYGGLRDGEEIRPTLREYYTRRILKTPVGGEHNEEDRPIGLGGAIAGIEANVQGHDHAGQDRPTGTPFLKALERIRSAFRSWDKLDGKQRLELRRVWVAMVDDLPRELRVLLDELTSRDE